MMNFELLLLKSARALLMSLFLGSLLACTTPPVDDKPKKPAQAAKQRAQKGTALWVIRFANELEPQVQPTSLAVFIENVPRTHGGPFTAKAHEVAPGRHAEFVVRVDLPPGDYRVTRVFGTAGEGNEASQFDFGTRMSFSVIDRETTYIGNLEITNRARQHDKQPATAPAPNGRPDAARFSEGTPLVTANDAYAGDVVTIHTLWPDLRSRRIAKRIPQRLVVLTPENMVVGGVESRFPAPGAPSGSYVKGSSIDEKAGQDLSSSAQKAFTRFGRMSSPRAFAVGEGEETFGMASAGKDVVTRALAACNAKRNARVDSKPCRLYAVDDTVLSEPVTRPTVDRGKTAPARRTAVASSDFVDTGEARAAPGVEPTASSARASPSR
jgi:hypothetical protein